MAESSVPGAVGERATGAGDCGGAHHYGLCRSCGVYITSSGGAVGEREEPLDVERLGLAMEWACDDLSVTSLSPADAPILFARLSVRAAVGNPPHGWIEKVSGRSVDDWECKCGAFGSHSWMGFAYHLLARLSVNEGGVAPVEPQEPR